MDLTNELSTPHREETAQDWSLKESPPGTHQRHSPSHASFQQASASCSDGQGEAAGRSLTALPQDREVLLPACHHSLGEHQLSHGHPFGSSA